MSKPKPRLSKPTARTRQATIEMIATPPPQQAEPNSFKQAVARVEETQASVEESRAVCDVWRRELESLDERTREVTRFFLDAQGILSAKESKLRREMEALRVETYKSDSREKCEAEMSNACLAKASRNY